MCSILLHCQTTMKENRIRMTTHIFCSCGWNFAAQQIIFNLSNLVICMFFFNFKYNLNNEYLHQIDHWAIFKSITFLSINIMKKQDKVVQLCCVFLLECVVCIANNLFWISRDFLVNIWLDPRKNKSKSFATFCVLPWQDKNGYSDLNRTHSSFPNIPFNRFFGGKSISFRNISCWAMFQQPATLIKLII